MNDKFSKHAQEVIDLVRNGYDFSAAAAKVGVQAKTVSVWRTRGKADLENGRDTPYAQFWKDTESARLYAYSLVDNVLFSEALKGSVSACIKWLELHPVSKAQKKTDERIDQIVGKLEERLLADES